MSQLRDQNLERDAQWDAVFIKIAKILESLGLDVEQDFRFYRLDGQEHYSMVEMIDSNQLTGRVLIACHEALPGEGGFGLFIGGFNKVTSKPDSLDLLQK